MQATGLLPPLLTDQEQAALRWYLEEYCDWPYEQFAVRAQGIAAQLVTYGQRLYQAVFGSAEAQRIVQPWNLMPDAPRQVSLAGALPAALSLPWELLHDGHGFLALRSGAPVTIVRQLPEASLLVLPTPFTPPLRILLVTARPEGAGFVDPRSIARELLDEVQAQADADQVVVEVLRPPTLPALRARLADRQQPPVHLLHFDGHGVFDAEPAADPAQAEAPLHPDGQRLRGGGTGKLAFEDDTGGLDLIEAERLGNVLHASGVRLVVLTACQSAMSSPDDAFSSVAGRLIQGGVDAVIAMRASALVVAATRYCEAFYRHLARGTPVPTAHEQARQALHDTPQRHVHQRRRDEAGRPVVLHDWWLPQFYQQRPLMLTPGRPKGRRKPVPVPRLSGITEELHPRYGFSGRARELLTLERQLLRGKLVVVHGFGGVGKTTLALEAATWLTRTGMYAGALFVSFEQGGDAPWLLGELARHLDAYDGQFNPADAAAALARLRPRLTQQPTLIIADNLETLLPRGDAPDGDAAGDSGQAARRTALWEVLLALRDTGCGVVLTTRDTGFGDGRLAPGQRVAHLALGGLYPPDAYALALRLMDSLGIDPRRVPYRPLCDLLEQLDHHPLALHLVLPALQAHPVQTLSADLAQLLPQFADDTVQGRNRSLLASLDYSLRRLTAAQRALLPRLALFEGGANEVTLREITETPESEWAMLRPALEQAALLRAEQVHAQVGTPFLHFHPVLAPFLRGQPGADDAPLRQRYAQRYADLARYLSYEDDRNPQPVRALVRRELPNLRRALELLLATGAQDAAVDMAESIARFLYVFGLLHERAALRARVSAAVGAHDDRPPTTDTGRGADAPAHATLTRAGYLHERGLGEDEWQRGDLRAAYARFTALLARMEALPPGAALGVGSYEHGHTLQSLARCLEFGGQPAAAEPLLRRALAGIDALIAAHPDSQLFIGQRAALLTDLGDVLRLQGSFPAARSAYEEALEIIRGMHDTRSEGAILAQLGSLALEQRDYAEAEERYRAALALFRRLHEPGAEATVWHQLGMVAEAQRAWAEAERCYREALALREHHSSAADVAKTCNQLAIVAEGAGRPAEAEGWYRRALAMAEQLKDNRLLAGSCNNLAALLLPDPARRAEARGYAERALAIAEQLGDPSIPLWLPLSILAEIAEAEERTDAARAYRRRERETFAAFAGNRWHIDRQHGQLIAAIAAAARGDAAMRTAVEEALPQLEEHGWRIADATRRIWAGSGTGMRWWRGSTATRRCWCGGCWRSWGSTTAARRGDPGCPQTGMAQACRHDNTGGRR